MELITIALDAMGGDAGAKVTVPAALRVLKSHQHIRIILVGNENALRKRLKILHAKESERLVVHHASEKVEMDEPPAQALRYKKDSSMRVAVNLVKSGEASACVSAGNTGALMATAKFVLKMLDGIDRPAIVSNLPILKVDESGPTLMLDLGANVDSSAKNLFQFAVMGSELAMAQGCKEPKVALLNIGEEQVKGNELVKQVDALLQEANGINYVGYIEGDDIFSGHVNVIVCDGFVGNVALKTAEGVAQNILYSFKKQFYRNWFYKIVGLFSKMALKSYTDRSRPDNNNGACLLGLKGLVIKSHGSASINGFEVAINKAIVAVENDLTKRINARVKSFFQEGNE